MPILCLDLPFDPYLIIPYYNLVLFKYFLNLKFIHILFILLHKSAKVILAKD